MRNFEYLGHGFAFAWIDLLQFFSHTFAQRTIESSILKGQFKISWFFGFTHAIFVQHSRGLCEIYVMHFKRFRDVDTLNSKTTDNIDVNYI